MAKVRVTKGDNRTGFVDEAQLATARAQGWAPATEEDVTAAKLRREASTALGTFEAGTQAVARGVSLGYSDSLLRAGGVDARRMNANRESLGEAGTALEVAGALAPALLSGGTGAAATAARFTLAGRTAQVGRAISGATEAALGRGVVGRVAGGAAAGAFEGGIAGMGAAASEAALGDRDLAAEHLLSGLEAGAGLGSLFGAGSTTLGIGLDRAYRGSQRVGRGLVDRALGAGDDAGTAAGRASLTGESVIERAAQRQVRLLGGGDDAAAAASRHLARTRTTEGRALMELAERGGGAVDDAVGQRLRSSVGRTSSKGHVDAWAKGLDGSGGKVVQRQAAEGYRALAKVQTPGAKAVRRLLRAESSRVQGFEGYATARDRLAAAIDDARAQGDVGLPEIEAAAGSYLSSASDPAVWGQGVAAAGTVRAAQAAERQALAALPSRARKALETGGELDDATARELAKRPDELAKILEARHGVADALEGVGQDVAELRKGIDDVRGALKYRSSVSEAAADAAQLRALEDGAGGMAREGLKIGGRAVGSVLGGLSFGGAALGELAGQVLGAATRPAAAIRTIARARGAIDAVRARQGAAVEAFGVLAEGVVRGARGAGQAARRVPAAVARQEARTRRAGTLETLGRVQALAADPGKLAGDIGPAVVHLRAAAPNVAGSVIAGAARAAAYLAAVAPPVVRPTFAGDVAMVDPFALDAWQRRVDVVSDPNAALDKLGAGTLAKEEAETLAAVYPARWREVQQQLLEAVGARSRTGKPVSFEARTQLSVLGGLVLDDSMRPLDYAQIQQSMVVEPPHPAAPPPRSQIKPTAPSLPTKWQTMEGKA
jgi:hypothetical protein